jgi:hypothetical protein
MPSFHGRRAMHEQMAYTHGLPAGTELAMLKGPLLV